MRSLFSPEPDQWGLRGDPHLWRALRDALAETAIPGTDEAVEDLLVARVRDLTGVDLRHERQEAVYREDLAHGGISSGHLHVPTWRDRLVPLLVARAAASRRG